MTDRERAQQVQAGAPDDILQIAGWPGGLNKATHPSRLTEDELALATNVVLGPRGSIKVRPGAELFESGLHNINYICTNNHPYYGITRVPDDQLKLSGSLAGLALICNTTQNGGAADFICIDKSGAASAHINEGFDAANILNEKPGIIQMANRIYISSIGAAWEMNPDTGANPSFTNLTGWLGTADTTTQYPESYVVARIYDRVFAADVGNDLVIQKKRLFWSDPLLPKSWKAANYIDIGPEDGQRIWKILYFADQIILFRDHSIYAIAGTDFEGGNLRVYELDGSLGTSVPWTVVETELGVVFFDTSKGIFLYNGSSFTNIGEAVFDYISANMGDIRLSPNCWVVDNKLHLSVPWVGDNFNNQRTFVFDFETGGWTEWDRGYDAVVLMPRTSGRFNEDNGPDFVLACSNAPGPSNFQGVHEISYDTPTIEGAGIPITVRSGWLSPSSELLKHRLRQVSLDFSSVAEQTTVNLYTDYETTTPKTSEIFDLTSTTEDGVLLRTHAFNGFRWRNVAFELTATVQSKWELRSIKMLQTAFQQVRGHKDGF